MKGHSKGSARLNVTQTALTTNTSFWGRLTGQVVCSETYRRLYGQRGESRGRLSRPDRDHANPARRDGNGGETGDVSTRYVICQTERADSFCIPCPSSHVPDWAALSAADKPMAAQVTPESDSHDGVASVQSVSEDKKDEVRSISRFGRRTYAR